MSKSPGDKQYDLEERTYEFARDIRAFIRTLPRTISNIEDVKQVVRSSGSIGANYIEANEALTKKEFRYRIGVSRRETKETRMWLRLLYTQEDGPLEESRTKLLQECTELLKIFGAIIRKSE